MANHCSSAKTQNAFTILYFVSLQVELWRRYLVLSKVTLNRPKQKKTIVNNVPRLQLIVRFGRSVCGAVWQQIVHYRIVRMLGAIIYSLVHFIVSEYSATYVFTASPESSEQAVNCRCGIEKALLIHQSHSPFANSNVSRIYSSR